VDYVRRAGELRPVILALRLLAGHLLAGALGGAVALVAPDARAEGADDKAVELVDQALDNVRSRQYDDANKKLAEAQRLCVSQGCSSTVKADIYLAQGYAVGLKGDLAEAQKRFEWALAENPSATPDERYTTRALKAAFDEASTRVSEGNGAQPPKPAGQLTAEQKEAIATAEGQLKDNDWEGCLQTMIVSTSVEEYSAGKLMLARCQDKGGLLLEARKDAGAALDLATAEGNDALVKEIEEYLQFLDAETPKIRLKIQSGISDVVVKIDNTVVPKDQVKEPILHNPGAAVIEVTGKRGGQPYEFTQEIRFQRKETIDLEVRSDVTPYQACLNKARTQPEKEECERIFGEKQQTTYRAGLEVASYNDNDNVDVVSPSIYASIVQPTEGWNVGASVLVDVVTTASADIVTTASRRFDDVRFAASLNGGYKVGPVTPSLHGAVSVESDYIGRTVGASITGDFADKMISPYIGYSLGFDILGRADTEFEVFSRDIFTHDISVGTSLVFNATTIGVIAATIEIVDGDTSKPYRHVAMFSEGVVDALPRAATPDLVAAARLDMMPLEQLPDDRQRYALLFRGAHRFETATLRGDERLYVDSWGQMASTTDLRILWDFYTPEGKDGGDAFPQMRLTPHARFHIQGPVDFWQRAYVAVPTQNGFQIPALRTADRELGPLFSVTAGLGLRAAVTSELALAVQAEGLYTQFGDHLYIYDRFGLFTASTMELEFD
jgi:hypothetical protein